MNHTLYIQQINNFGENLKYLRTKRGLTCTEVSIKLNIPKGSMSVYELGYNLASIDRMIRIAEFYGLDDYRYLLLNNEQLRTKA